MLVPPCLVAAPKRDKRLARLLLRALVNSLNVLARRGGSVFECVRPVAFARCLKKVAVERGENDVLAADAIVIERAMNVRLSCVRCRERLSAFDPAVQTITRRFEAGDYATIEQLRDDWLKLIVSGTRGG